MKLLNKRRKSEDLIETYDVICLGDYLSYRK